MNFHKLANEIFKQAGNRVLQGRAEGCLGVAHRGIGYCERATSHEEDLATAIEVGDKAGEILALSGEALAIPKEPLSTTRKI